MSNALKSGDLRYVRDAEIASRLLGNEGDAPLNLNYASKRNKDTTARRLGRKGEAPLNISKANWPSGGDKDILSRSNIFKSEGGGVEMRSRTPREEDSLLADRRGAERSWAVSQVNERLTPPVALRLQYQLRRKARPRDTATVYLPHQV